MAVSGRGRGFIYGNVLQLHDQAGLSIDQQYSVRPLDRLDNFARWPTSKMNPERRTAKELSDLQPGGPTIANLSYLSVDTVTVCTLFDICLSVAKE